MYLLSLPTGQRTQLRETHAHWVVHPYPPVSGDSSYILYISYLRSAIHVALSMTTTCT